MNDTYYQTATSQPRILSFALIAIMGCSVLLTPQSASANPILGAIGKVIFGRVIKTAWEGKNNSRSPDVYRVKRTLQNLEQDHPDYAPAIRRLRNSVDSTTSYSEYEEEAMACMKDLRTQVEANSRDIRELQSEVLKLQNTVYGQSSAPNLEGTSIIPFSSVQQITASNGYKVYNRASTSAKVVKTQRSHEVINVKAKKVVEGKTFYISDWSYSRMSKGDSPNYILIN